MLKRDFSLGDWSLGTGTLQGTDWETRDKHISLLGLFSEAFSRERVRVKDSGCVETRREPVTLKGPKVLGWVWAFETGIYGQRDKGRKHNLQKSPVHVGITLSYSLSPLRESQSRG